MPNKPSIFSKKLNRLLFFTSLSCLIAANTGFAHERQTAVVQEILTGNAVRLEGGKLLSYIGLHAPPLQSKIPLVRDYGQNAFVFNQKLVAEKKIQIEWGPQIRDDQGNLLGYVFLEDGTFVNLEILKAGCGRWVRSAPNLKYSGLFRKAELEARRDKRGIWKEEPQNPYIKKEYIGDKITKIYYFPTSPELERIPQAQWVTFSSVVEAHAAGYRACFNCREEKITDY